VKRPRSGFDPIHAEAVRIAKVTGRKRREVERELYGMEHQRFMRRFSYVLVLILIFYVAGLAAVVSKAG